MKQKSSTILNTSYFQCSFDRLCKNKRLFRSFPLSLFRLYLWFIHLTKSIRLFICTIKIHAQGPGLKFKKMLLENKHILKQI